MRIHEPPEVFGLIPPLAVLVERYEDEPDARTATGEEIVGVLAAYCERAPRPLS